MNHKLEVDGVQLSFGLNQILSDVYFKCDTGKITGLLGRNGAGKTCLMNIIYGSLIYQMSVLPLIIIALGRFSLMREYYFLLLMLQAPRVIYLLI